MSPNGLILMTVAVVLAVAQGSGEGRKRSSGPNSQDQITLDRVARYPPPGQRVAGGFRFCHDARHLYFLRIEGEGVSRSLVREEVSSGTREVVARPPQETAGETPAGREEILRRERQRIQDQGITLYHLAAAADVAVFDWRGDVYLARPSQEPLRLTQTSSAEIDPQLSPDGTRVAFVRDGDLYVLDVAKLSEIRLTEGAREGVSHGTAEFIAQEEMDRDSGFWWSPDGARIAYTETDETSIPPYPIVHQGKSSWDVESPRYPFAGGPNARIRLGVVPASGGKTVWMRLNTGDDDFYVPRVRWEKNDSLLVQVESRDQKSLKLLRADAQSGETRVLLEDRTDTWINLHDDLHPLKDGRFLWSSESTGFRHLELRARDGSMVRSLTFGDWAVDRLEGVDESRGLVYFTAAKDGAMERPLYSVPLEGGAVERITTEPGWHTVTCPPNTVPHFVDVLDSAASPPRAVLKEATGRQIRVLDSNPDPEPAAIALRAPEFVTLESKGRLPLLGAIYRPQRMEAGKKYPAIVRVYGGPTAQTVKNSWEVTADLRAQYLARHGYIVFRLDNRGTPRRGKTFETALVAHLGSVEVEDQIVGARYLAGLPYVDGTRIGIYGWSYGGYMAARCLMKAPDVFKAAVAGAPVADWDGYDTHYTERYMGSPQQNPEGYRESSLLPLASQLRGRLLIVHGMVDENVHFRHSARLADALNSAEKRYELLIFPDERHLPRAQADRRYMEERLVEFFDRALK